MIYIMNIEIFKNKFITNIKLNQKLAKFTWFGVGGNAEILFIPEDKKSLMNFLKNKPQEYKVLLLELGQTF